MKKTNRQIFLKVPPIFGPFAVLFIFMVLSSAAISTGRALAHNALEQGASLASSDSTATISAPISINTNSNLAQNNTTDPMELVTDAVHTAEVEPDGLFVSWSFDTLRTMANELAISWGTIPSPTIFLPYVTHIFTQAQEMPLADRVGFGLTSAALAPYTDVATLGAGWYLDWRVRETPERPAGMDYVQMIRVHQKLSCGEWYHGDRAACPYAEPLDYRYRPSQSAIEAAAVANPGAIWLIGNEMDRIDWSYCVTWNGSHCDVVGYNGQDEILPETYAVAYHDLYGIIKAADPSARVAIGGVIQPTPLRLQYLTAIWDAYQQTYSETMPVDVWNVHNFIIREKANDWGADIPPGIEGTIGEYVVADTDPQLAHVDMAIFKAQIVAFRQWMKSHGQQNKPLIISEYGVLFHNSLINPVWPSSDPSYVQEFMIDSFDYFATAKDCNLGYIPDGCRLVQKWNWYSLDDTWGSFNPHSRLIHPTTKEMTSTGQRFQEYMADNQ